MSSRGVLNQTWQNVVHGFSHYMDKSGRAFEGSVAQRVIDTTEFRAAAGYAVLNTGIASQYGAAETSVAVVASVIGGAIPVGIEYLRNENENTGIMINKNPTAQEQWLYGAESQSRAKVEIEEVQQSMYIPHLAGLMVLATATTVAATGLMEIKDHLTSLPHIFSAYSFQGIATYLGGIITPVACEGFAKLERLKHVADGDWVIQPPGTQKPNESADHGLLPEGEFLASPVPVSV